MLSSASLHNILEMRTLCLYLQICNTILGNGQNIKKIVSEYDQEIPQSQTADKPMTPRGRASQLDISQDTRKTN